MPNFLDSIQLPDQVIWVEQHQSQGVAQSVTPLLGGNIHISTAAVLSGKSMTLVFAEEVEWAEQAHVDAILLLAETPGATFIVQWEGKSYNVAFRHHEAPAVSFDPIWPFYADYVGVIKLITV